MVAEACPVLVSENRVQPGEGPVNGRGNYDPLKVTVRVALVKSGYMLGRLSIPHYPLAFRPSPPQREKADQ